MYGIPRERVIGSSSTFAYTSNEQGGTITHKPEADYLDDGPEKPVRIWNRTGRRPLLAAGNSNGDVPMLEFTHHPTSRPCGCCCSTTMPSANSTTPVRRRAGAQAGRDRRLDGREHQERLDHRLLMCPGRSGRRHLPEVMPW